MMTNNTERAQVGWGFWLWWVLASTVGLNMDLAVAEAVGDAVAGAVAWASLGIAQWLVLRRQVSQAGWWILATLAAFAVGDALGLVVDDSAGELVGIFLIGITQWTVLRKQVSRAGWWVLASTVGFAVGIVGFAVAEAVGDAGAVGNAVAGAVAGVGYGTITGGVLVWLMRQPAADEDEIDWAFQIYPLLLVAAGAGILFAIEGDILTGAGLILAAIAIGVLITMAAMRCPRCKRFWTAEHIRSEVIQKARGLKAEKTRDHYQCENCGHTWTKLKIDRRTRAKGGPQR